MGAFIQIRDLVKTYQIGGQHVMALRGINLDIERSDFVVFMGHSGSGKTTLISSIGGLTRPTEGKVYIEGDDLWRLNDKALSSFRNRKIGFIFQSFSLLPSLNVLNNVVMPVIFRNNTRKDKEIISSKAFSLLEDLDMKGKVNSFPSELSGGEQRRVAIARALMNDPEIILADEPTGELDIRTEREVIEIFHRINESYKKTVIVVSHTLTWIEKAKTVAIMKDGLIYKDVDDPEKMLMETSNRWEY
jgi:ABC-type lipoprotein export system ATPase subunit